MTKNKISLQTKSFIALFITALLGVIICLWLWADLIYTPYALNIIRNDRFYSINNQTLNQKKSNPANVQDEPTIDTSAWKTYTNKQYKLSFKYSPDWKVLAVAEKSGFSIVQVDPGKKYYNFKIYISPKSFYILDGLPTKTEIIGGEQALNVNNALYGIKANNSFYTFDIGFSMSLLPQFDAMVHSVKFGK